MVDIGYVQEDRSDISKYDIFSASEKKELFDVFEQKERDYLERRKDMTEEEQVEAVEKLDAELGKIFEQFKERALKKQQNTATA